MASEAVEGATIPPRHRSKRRLASPARQTITDSVRALLMVRRLDELTVQEIVERAKVSRPTFYAYFETKYSVVAALVADMGQTIYDHWEPFFEEDGPIEEATIRNLGVITLRAWRAQATLFSATIEGWHNDQEIHDSWNHVLEQFAQALMTRLGKVRRLRADDDMVVTALVSLFERCVYLAVATPDSPLGRSDDELAGVLAMMWTSCLRLDATDARTPQMAGRQKPGDELASDVPPRRS